MNRYRALAAALLVAALLAAWFLLAGSRRERTLSGYIEGDDLYLSSPVSGTVGSVAAVEGTRVAAGQALFSVDPGTLSAQGEQAQANLSAMHTQIASAEAATRQAEAEVTAAQAQAEKARSDLARLQSVKADDPAAVAGKDLDAARSALRDADARVTAARQAVGARRAQVEAAQAQANEARGGEREVQIRVGQLSPKAPTAGRVDEVFFQPGEWVSANQPVVSLLPDEKVKIRFFVPEQSVARYRPGATIRFSCDSCGGARSAVVRYVSPKPEFTPPIIFSRDSRDRLVFMVEAYPDRPRDLQPGLPVDVEPLP